MRNKNVLTFIVLVISIMMVFTGCGKKENVSSGNRPNHGNEGGNIGGINTEGNNTEGNNTEEIVQVEKIETLVLKQETKGSKNKVYKYDENGLVTKIITYASDGSYSEAEIYNYDKNGNLIEKVYMSGSALEKREAYAYDNKGRVAKKTEEKYPQGDSYGFSYTYEYDEQDRIIKEFVEPFNLADERPCTVEYAYDEDGRLIKKGNYTYTYEEQITDNGMKIEICKTYSDDWRYVDGNRYVYNSAGQLVEAYEDIKEDGSGYEDYYNYEYDSNGNLIKVTDGKWVVQKMEYETILVNNQYVYKEIIAPDIQEKVLEAGEYIPLGGIYYVKNTGEVLLYLDKFPTEAVSGDTYEERGYEYKFNSAGELSVKVKQSGYTNQESYAPLKEKVMGIPLTNMFKTFEDCRNMVEAPEIPKTVTSMSGTFYNCNELLEAPEIPEGVKDISYLFYNCVSMEKATSLPEGITNMSWAFYNCEKLVELPKIPSTVVAMSAAFRRCFSAVSAPTIPENVTQMDSAFSLCTSLTGNIVINAQFNSTEYVNYAKCFEKVNFAEQNITLTGSSPYLAEIEATSGR